VALVFSGDSTQLGGCFASLSQICRFEAHSSHLLKSDLEGHSPLERILNDSILATSSTSDDCSEQEVFDYESTVDRSYQSRTHLHFHFLTWSSVTLSSACLLNCVPLSDYEPKTVAEGTNCSCSSNCYCGVKN